MCFGRPKSEAPSMTIVISTGKKQRGIFVRNGGAQNLYNFVFQTLRVANNGIQWGPFTGYRDETGQNEYDDGPATFTLYVPPSKASWVRNEAHKRNYSVR